ncbi:MAG: hypothetical protein ACKO0N_08660, partial [Planctomycetota bacterium]
AKTLDPPCKSPDGVTLVVPPKTKTASNSPSELTLVSRKGASKYRLAQLATNWLPARVSKSQRTKLKTAAFVFFVQKNAVAWISRPSQTSPTGANKAFSVFSKQSRPPTRYTAEKMAKPATTKHATKAANCRFWAKDLEASVGWGNWVTAVNKRGFSYPVSVAHINAQLEAKEGQLGKSRAKCVKALA